MIKTPLTRNKSRSTMLFAAIVGASLVARVFLQYILPIWARGDHVVDDVMMAMYADTLSDGLWLGEYNVNALNKIAGYPMFVAVSNSLGLPYMLTLGAFYATASLVFLCVLRKFTDNKLIQLGCFWYVLFSPIMFDDNVTQRIYRQSIIPALVLIIVSSYLAMYKERNNGMKKIVPWVIAASLCYGYFAIIREDAAWFTCFIYGATVVLLGLFIIENRKRFSVKKLSGCVVCLLCPLIASVITTNAICMINYSHYGLYVKNDFNETNFASVCKLLMSIEPEEEMPYVYISKSTLDRAFEASPTFREMQDEMQQRYDTPTSSGLNHGEFYKAMFAWNLRWAADAAGLYQDPLAMNEYFGKVKSELQTAFDTGVFQKRDAIVLSPYARPIRTDDIFDILKYSFQGYKDVVTFTDIDSAVVPASGPQHNLAVMRDVTNHTLPETTFEWHFKGWAFAYDVNEPLSIVIYDKNGNTFVPAYTDSPDVYTHFLTNGAEYSAASRCRFEGVISETTMDVNNLFMKVTVGDRVVYDGSANGVQSLSDESFVMNVEQATLAENTDGIVTALQSSKWINRMIKLYQLSAPVIVVLAFLVFLMELIVNVYRKLKKQPTNFSFWLIKFGMLMTIWANLVVIAVNYFETDPNDYREYYAAGVYPIWQIFVCLTVCTLVGYVKPWIKAWWQKRKLSSTAQEPISAEAVSEQAN